MKCVNSERMRRIRRSGTSGEILFESLLAQITRAYTKQHCVHAVTPDFILRREKIAVFIDGDFWHGRAAVEFGALGLKRALRGPTRTFWITKILRNVERDRRQTFSLRRRGWSVVRIWESDLRKNQEQVVAKIRKAIEVRKIRLRRPQSNAS